MNQCCLCKSKKSQIEYKLNHYQVLTCQKCGLLRRDIQLSPKKLEQLFSPLYFTKEQKDYFAGQFSTRINSKLPRNQQFISRLNIIENLVGRKKKTILDIGCGSGTFLKLAHNRHWKTLGVDLADYPVKFAREKFGLKVIKKSIEKAKIPSHSFNAVVCWDVISNFQNPDRVFQETYRILRPGGIFAFEVAVVDSLLNWASNFVYYTTAGRINRFTQIGLPFQHAYHFTRSSIRQLAKKHKFIPLKTENDEMDYRYSSLPKQFLPLLSTIASIAKVIGKTTRYRMYLKKPD